MATSPDTIETILSRVGDALEITPRKMFGEYGLYVDGKMVAMVCDDRLFVKETHPGLAILGEHETAAPYRGAKPAPLVDDAFSASPGNLAELLRATAKALPAPKPKTTRASSRARKA